LWNNSKKTFWNIINLFGDAATDVKGSIGVFAKTFAPPERKDGVGLYVILDIVAMGYASIMAPFWNRWARNLDWSKRNSDDFDTIKDLVNDMTYQGITLAKDLITQEDKDIDPEALLEYQVSGITRAWRGGMQSYAKTLFNGSDASIKRMSKLMASGKLLDPLSQLDNAVGINLELKKTLYGMLVPLAWRVAGRDLNPLYVLPLKLPREQADSFSAQHPRQRAELPGRAQRRVDQECTRQRHSQ
jgi:hypothetical protein